VREFFDSRLRAFSFGFSMQHFHLKKKSRKQKYPTAELDNSRELQGHNKVSQNNKQLQIYYFSLSIGLSARVDWEELYSNITFQDRHV
jgi:hypothetical protein